MICPACGCDAPRDEERCPECGEVLLEAADHVDHTMVLRDDQGKEGDPPSLEEHDHTVEISAAHLVGHEETLDSHAPGESRGAAATLEVGEAFGDRYRIERLLGFGGMGAVYKAWDEQVDIPVALKVVRPGSDVDPEMTRQLDRRFKRELLLARQVTHKNVVRIHDMGTVGDVKFITMTYIDGEDLAGVLKRQGTLPVVEALRVMRPALSGLVAAHEAGVVHRDLKPANIMVEPSTGQSYIMDFGIAKSAAIDREVLAGSGDGATAIAAALGGETQASGIVGTLQYMAPEQMFGTEVDQRADVYAFGLIFYDLLVGRRRIEKAASAIGEFRGRVAAAPPPPRSIEPAVPEALDAIICKCLEPDPEARFQSSADLQEALDRLDDKGEPLPVKRVFTPTLLVAAGALVAAIVGGTWWLASLMTPAAPTEPMTVLVADFVNTTDDAAFDGALEQTLAIAMEGAGFISAFPSATARKIADQLQPGSRLDEDMARLVSRREGVSVVLVGSIDRGDRGYTVEVDALDPGVEAGEGRPLASARAVAKDREGVLAAVAEVASELRGELGDQTPQSDRLAAAETFTTASLDAMRDYARAQDLSVQGKFEAALGSYEDAVEHDPGFGRAWAGMGVVYGNLRQEDKAEAAYQRALQNLDRMSERERYRTLGGYYLLVARNYDKAIENYETLVELFPADGGGHSNLALAYLNVRDFDKAVASGAEAVELDPRNVIKRMNYAMYAMYAGDFATSMEQSKVVFEQNPAFGYALFT
ncbi:MAG TPA: serine/threonine-protein kinase, partial [Candidatus Sulfomarinibacteraceae bacterium]|nr:serine/threonine-protein kinase [Candidatus Sulfomarinibacteraceae bacterium]